MDMEPDMFGQPSIKAIISALKELESASSGAATRSPRAEINKVIALLEKSGCHSVAEFAEELRTAAPARGARGQTASPTDEDLVEDYLRRLAAANATPDEFGSILEKMLKDKKVRAKQELKEIANRYIGASGSYAKKADAKDAIKRKFHDRWVSNQYKLKAG